MINNKLKLIIYSIRNQVNHELNHELIIDHESFSHVIVYEILINIVIIILFGIEIVWNFLNASK